MVSDKVKKRRSDGLKRHQTWLNKGENRIKHNAKMKAQYYLKKEYYMKKHRQRRYRIKLEKSLVIIWKKRGLI